MKFSPRRGWRRLAGLAWLCVFAVLSGAAAPWYARVWQADEGLPGDSVTGVAQTRNGLLWIATHAGLCRFDGLKFHPLPMPTGRPYRIIRDLLLDRDEQLWLPEELGVVVKFDTRTGRVTEITNNLPRSQPMSLAQTRDGAVWVAYADGSVCRVQGDTVRRFTEDDGLPSGAAATLLAEANGSLRFVQAGRMGVFQDDRFVLQSTLPDRVTALLRARNGTLLICSGFQLLRQTGDLPPVEIARLPVRLGVVRPTRLLEDAGGALWIGTMSHGLFRYDGTNVVAVETSHGRIKSLLADREGNVWVGTDGGGLNRLRPRVVELLGKDSGLPFDTVRSVCEDAAGTIWVVTQNGNLAILEDGRWRLLTSADGWQGGDATCVTTDHAGVVHIGTFSRGVHRWQAGKFISPIQAIQGLARPGIRGLLPDREGNLWIAFSSGEVLQRYRDGRFQNYALPPGGRAVRTLTQDTAGVIWMANLDGRLLRVDGDVVVDETARTPEPHRTIRCLIGTPDGSLWIGYSVAGLGRLKDGHFVRLEREHGLPDNRICSLMPGERGWMWVGSDHGIFRASLEQLTAVAEGRAARVECTSHGRDDGLPSLQAYYGYAPGATRTRDGRVLIPTHSGLAMVRPDLVRPSPVPPDVLIQRAQVDGAALPLDVTAPVALAPAHHKLTFAFTAPSFIEPEKVRFRYRLEGWDEDWIETEGERATAYSRLPAGKYRFQVTAGNSAGVWNPTGANFAFEVKPFFWQTWPFRLAVVALFTGAVFGVTRYISVRRLQQQVRLLEQENALQRERARIAQDIHDDLGARLTQISLLTELTERQLTQPAATRDHVGQIATLSRQGIKSLDEIVWAVNPRNDTLADLLDFAGQYAVDFLRTAEIRCRLDFPDVDAARTLAADVRHGLFLAVKEALTNVVKHARATEVWMRVRVAPQCLHWEVEDNGCGFTVPPDDALADGLRNMRARLAELGGVCSIEGRTGQGTRIRFEVPLPKAETPASREPSLQS